jgi:hypothetical protein
MPNTLYEAGRQAMLSHQTRAKLRQVAERIATTARAMGQADQLDATLTVTEGTRPKGRPYARVTMAGGDDEFGKSGVPRRRTFARAVSASARTGRR